MNYVFLFTHVSAVYSSPINIDSELQTMMDYPLLEFDSCLHNEYHRLSFVLSQVCQCPKRAFVHWIYLAYLKLASTCFFIVFTGDVLTCHRRKSTGGTNHVNDDSAPAIDVISYTCVWEGKMSSVKKLYSVCLLWLCAAVLFRLCTLSGEPTSWLGTSN